MKKLLVALILGVILTATLATPAFAGDGKGNMPGNADDLEPWRGLKNAIGHTNWGAIMGNGFLNAPGMYAFVHAWYHITSGQPPAKPYWAGGPK